MEEKKIKKLGVEKMVKAGMFVVIGLVLVVANFVLEGALADDVEMQVVENDYFSDGGVVRLAEGADGLKSAALNLVEFGDVKLWGNFQNSGDPVALYSGKVVLMPNGASFSLEFEGNRLKMEVYQGDVYLGFLPDDYVLDEVATPYDAVFTNKLLVPRGRQIEINVNRLDERFEKLLYSKLVKEFKYAFIPATSYKEEWVKTNMLEDEKLLSEAKQQFGSKVLRSGVSVNEGFLGNFVFWAEENLTFVPNRKQEVMYGHLFNYLDDALFHLLDGEEGKYLVSMQSFDNYFAAMPREFKEAAAYDEIFDGYYDRLKVFAPGDKGYRALTDLLERRFEAAELGSEERFNLVNELWLDVYESLDADRLLVENALNSYYQYFDQTLGEIEDGDHYRYYITFNNQLFDNLLLTSPVFYKDGYFEMKNVLEQELVKIYADGQLKDELQQALVSMKITFLKRLMLHFFDGDLGVPEAKVILARLVEEISDLMPNSGDRVAVVKLFESELEDIDDFWGYLNSPEYHSSKSYGTTQEIRYQSYLDEKDKIWSFIDIQADILGEKDIEVTFADVVKEVEAAFDEVNGVIGLEVAELEDLSQRYVSINASVAGYPIVAQFDRDTGLVKEVYAYGELISDRAVRVGNLFDILTSKFANRSGEDAVAAGDLDAATEETYAQRFARKFIADKMREAGFMVELEDVSIVDADEAVYRVTAARVPDKSKVEVTFDFRMNGEMAVNLYLLVNDDPVVLSGEFTLEEVFALAMTEGEINSGDDGGGVTR